MLKYGNPTRFKFIERPTTQLRALLVCLPLGGDNATTTTTTYRSLLTGGRRPGREVGRDISVFRYSVATVAAKNDRTSRLVGRPPCRPIGSRCRFSFCQQLLYRRPVGYGYNRAWLQPWSTTVLLFLSNVTLSLL